MSSGIDGPNMGPPNPAPKLSPAGIVLVYLVVLTLLVALLARTFEASIPATLTIDGWTLTYIIAIFVVALIPYWLPLVQSFTIGKDSVSVTFRALRRLENEVSQTRALAEDTASKAEDNLQATLDIEALNNSRSLGIDPVEEVVKKLQHYKGPSSTDPNKGQFGGSAFQNGRVLSADIVPIATEHGDRARVTLTVRSIDPVLPLMEPVTFHLHPTFRRTSVTVTPRRGVARLSIIAWGAFTVGATTDNGATRLELDLEKVPNRPQWFAEQ